MSVAQGRHGYVQVGGVKYPCYNWGIRTPRNITPGMPTGSTWATHFAEGAQSSRIVMSFELREKMTESLALAFWQRWTARTFTGGFDDTATSTVVVASGMKTRTFSNCKAESFVLTCAFGQPIGLQAVFLAPGKPSLADALVTDYSHLDTSPPLMFDRLTVGGLTGNVYGIELSYTNNHQPDAPLTGTKVLAGWDAGAMGVGFSVRVKEHATSGAPFSDGDTASLTLNGASGGSRLFTLTSLAANNPDDVDVNPGQIYQTYQALVMGSATTAPLVIT